MKSRISKHKRIISKRKTFKRIIGGVLLTVVFTVSAGTVMPVHGEASDPRTVITEIYHKHVGTFGEKGGCYQQEIPHIHQGNETEGGSCYQTEIRHVHQGDETSGTGCYSRTVYHTHQGDGQSEGGCYGAQYHTHEETCYKDKICTIRYTKGDVIGTETKECDAHGQSVHEIAEGVGFHENCGMGEEAVHLEYCKECGIMSYSYHDYRELVCGKSTEEAESYVLICGKDETTIEGYETGCGFEQGSVERYELSCDKKTEGYARNCGLDEKAPVGKMIITNETEGSSEKVAVSVRVEDLSGGKLQFNEPAFVWYDETGKRIGSGERIEVEKNGNYTAEVRLRNPDVDESSLRSNIAVDNVLLREESSPSPRVETSPSPSSAPPTPSAGVQTTPEKDREEESPTEMPWPTEEPSDGDEPASPEETASPKETVTPQPILPSDEGNNSGESSTRREMEETDKDLGNAKAEEDMSDDAISEKPAIERKEEKKEAKENMASLSEPVKVKKTGFWQRIFADPKVRVFTIASGVLLLLSGLFLLLLYLLRSVRIYNDDGQGHFVRLGRCPVRLEEEGYAVTISEQMIEKTYTNRYCIKPGMFRLGKGQQEILVYKDTKRVSVELEREMIFVI